MPDLNALFWPRSIAMVGASPDTAGIRGRIVDAGSPAELIRRYGRTNLEDVFLDVARDRRQGDFGQDAPTGSPDLEADDV